MSNIYIQEPPTDGKILFHTSVGEIEVELWSKEAPKAGRNMIQLCLEGYYDGVIFHRIIKGFMAQTGDPSGTGLGGESIYGKPFKDEFHSRLKFNRRGLVGLANAGKDDNGSQFFFTFGPTPELNNKHTIVGKVVGNTLYNMLKLEEFLVDRNDRPKDPPKIVKTEILSNPFDDILPRTTRSDSKKSKKEENVDQVKGKKDFALLSFGDEAEEEDLLSSTEFKGKSKSSHDLLTDDPKLSSVPVVDPSELNIDGKRKPEDGDRKSKKKHKKDREEEKTLEYVPDDDDGESETDEKTKAEKEKLESIRNEYKQLKKEMATKKKVLIEEKVETPKDEAVVAFLEETEKYKNVSKTFSKKGSSREEEALALLAKFKNKLSGSKEEPEKEVPQSDSWMKHKFSCEKEDEKPVLAKDANMRGENDWYDIYDPRNKMNQRKAEMASSSGKKK